MRRILIAVILTLLNLASFAKAKSTSVAVVVDPLTYEYAKDAVDAYVSSVDCSDRKGLLLIDKWGVPDSLRQEFIRLHKESNLEGAVLIGDIPIPMIRDAQHLCSAFKMDQKRPWLESSVPSDRYYDDFGLAFTFLKKDEGRGDLFYYSLDADGEQTVSCDIYTARIKAPETPEKYERVRQFLLKAVAARDNSDPLDRVLHFAGHGYNSESLNARIDEHHALLQQIPALDAPGGRLDFINHDFDEAVKYRLLATLADPQLDLAILHHHGSPDTEYMNGSPYASMPDGWLRLAKNYFRSKMSASKNKEEAKAYYIERYGIPEAWLDEYLDPELARQDSLYAESLDLGLADLKKAKTGVRMVLFDACFNGAFINEDYVAANYLFNEGNETVLARAHSVNTLQDKWETAFLGLLGQGVCAGNWAKLDMDLDTHLLGDPLFCFGERTSLDHELAVTDLKFWKKQLDAEDCELRAAAMHILSREGKISADELLSIQEKDLSSTVRLEAMLLQVEAYAPTMVDALKAGMEDNYELTQRLACKYASRNYDPALTETAVKLYSSPTTSVRVLFQCKNVVWSADYDAVCAAFEKYPYWKGEEAQKELLASVKASLESERADGENLLVDEVKLKRARLYIRSQRNKCGLSAIDPMLACYSKTGDAELKLTIAEALGWYKYSCKRDYIREKCSELLDSETDARLRAELQKTVERLK